jgi:hypothetical protein
LPRSERFFRCHPVPPLGRDGAGRVGAQGGIGHTFCQKTPVFVGKIALSWANMNVNGPAAPFGRSAQDRLVRRKLKEWLKRRVGMTGIGTRPAAGKILTPQAQISLSLTPVTLK